MSSWKTLGIALVIAVGLAPIAHGATDDQKCAAKKIKAAGKKVFDKARCHQKATLHGTSVDQECLDKAEDKFNLQIAKADGLGTCAGTASGIEADVDACVATLVDDVLPPPAEICDNGQDDDGNTLVDCDDPSCATDALCALECTVPEECPGTDTECQQRTCESGGCGFSFTPADTPLAVQPIGDCETLVCDGVGVAVANPDPIDVPDDFNQCTQDACDGGNPTNSPFSAGFPCNQSGGTQCDGMGACVP